MPTFDFRCLKCKTTFEFARPFGSKTNPSCPECKSKKTEKLLTTPTIVFKGDGWYKTSRHGSRQAPGGNDETKPIEETKDSKETKEVKPKEIPAEKKPAAPKKD